MQPFDNVKYRQDRSSMIISDDDMRWAKSILYDTFVIEWLKKNPTAGYTTQGYFPPDIRKLGDAISVVNFLKLKDSPPLSILDVGAGPGLFLKLCLVHGHNVYGTEVPEIINSPVSDLYKHYNIDLFELVIKKSEKIVLPKQYDIIVASRTVFDEEDGYYKSDDWIEWKNQMFEHLNSNGKLFLKTNLKFFKNSIIPAQQEIVNAFGLPLLGWNSLTFLLKKN